METDDEREHIANILNNLVVGAQKRDYRRLAAPEGPLIILHD